MASVRSQIFTVVEGKLEAVRAALGWAAVLVNPREPVGDDEMNALLLATGGDVEPDGLTGHVATNVAEFAVGMVVRERQGNAAEDQLDAGFVAISDALTDPDDIQLGGLAVQIRRGAISPPYVGRALEDGARIIGVQEIEFSVEYWTNEGDASVPGP